MLNSFKTYLNNNSPTTHTPHADLDFSIESIKVGTNRNEGNRFNGLITLVNYYESELSSGDVSGLYTNNVVCYHKNTNILTDKGLEKIENLKRYDLIKTLNGYKPLSKLVKSINLKKTFVFFPKDSLGNNIPNEDFYITEAHPIYFKGEYYNSENFVGINGIEMVKDFTSHVYHLQFDSHEVIYSNNLTTTSLPHNTNYLDYHLKKNEFIDESKYKEDIIGKMYEPYVLHDIPLFHKKVKL